ncbi:carbohydrate ABC transporter permease [Streptomyces sp. NBC_00825]|uniref:carbohydrate ABC transporter permease n=1 Tax=unclassified Streptomyces TaxID=2593676 RepID=UPI00224E1D74|nr:MULTISPECIES: carbohydrate ABC transporter permease [unclassified Streptomyces]WTB51834.1 carbohydrate ABC transporter permease [Streptomyces sp. NBC_00826]WTH95273.1 carbohydrate ABC transporter permease [Streptomyces sp. NBC_00825]WTI04007.1 carbohydrate ABC transporter permease [Streptomyces sp. NBC_00822]MCX4869600.1 carbohydrate ABC transporter permease [Streptomyces sp. NBC_00906]MCX4900839.1 carbohydrate ABC transporter permease [Streptomyces sp. NBC_00892]
MKRNADSRVGSVMLGLFALVMLAPLYLVIVNAFKPESAIRQRPFSAAPGALSTDYLRAALSSPDYNIIKSFGVTVMFVVLVNVLSLALAGPASYVIARGTRRWHKGMLLVFLAGLFIPGQVLVIPVIYVLRFTGLMGTIPGFVLYEATLTLPLSMFLFVGYIKSIPRELDEAAQIDGAGRLRTFWQVIFPLMQPVVVTAIVLHTIGVWTDFVNPQIVLGPASGLYTVMTGVYSAIGLHTTDLSVVYPTLLLAIAPVLIFFVIMQRKIVGGLTAGATKG